MKAKEYLITVQQVIRIRSNRKLTNEQIEEIVLLDSPKIDANVYGDMNYSIKTLPKINIIEINKSGE